MQRNSRSTNEARGDDPGPHLRRSQAVEPAPDPATKSRYFNSVIFVNASRPAALSFAK